MDAHKKALGSHNRHEGRVCTKEGEGISVIKRRKRRGV